MLMLIRLSNTYPLCCVSCQLAFCVHASGFFFAPLNKVQICMSCMCVIFLHSRRCYSSTNRTSSPSLLTVFAWVVSYLISKDIESSVLCCMIIKMRYVMYILQNQHNIEISFFDPTIPEYKRQYLFDLCIKPTARREMFIVFLIFLFFFFYRMRYSCVELNVYCVE